MFTAQPRVVRGLLHLSLSVAIGGTLSAGLLHLGDAAGVASAPVDPTQVSLLAAQTSTADVAELDPVVRIEDAVPVGAVVDTVPAVAPVAPTIARISAPRAPAAPPTTVTPVPAAPAPAAPATPSQAEVVAVIREVFGPNGDAAIRVANCESHLNPRAISRGGSNWGLFQINKVHAKRVAAMGYRWEDLLDARVNTTVAKAIFDGSGWGPWACRPR
jgi:hypothetical protein